VALEVPASPPGAPPRTGQDSSPGVSGSKDPDPAAAVGSTIAGRPKSTRVVSASVSVWRRMGAIWERRQLLVHQSRTQIRVKYKSSVLGIVWSMVSPAMTLIIFFLVFQIILKNGMPNFVIFLFSGLLLWNFFQVGVQAGTGTVVANAGIVKKVAFPREILALAEVGSAMVYLFFQALVMVLFLVVLRSAPDWKLLPLLPLAFVACAFFAAALAVFLSAINVYLRDTQHLVEVLLTAWFWACPIVYSYQRTVSALLAAHHITWLYFLNPLTPLVMTFQRVLYNKTFAPTTTPDHKVTQWLPTWHAWTYVQADLIVLGVAAVLLVSAVALFGRLEGNFAEEL
jgi:ABC-2 type transport system permease protein